MAEIKAFKFKESDLTNIVVYKLFKNISPDFTNMDILKIILDALNITKDNPIFFQLYTHSFKGSVLHSLFIDSFIEKYEKGMFHNLQNMTFERIQDIKKKIQIIESQPRNLSKLPEKLNSGVDENTEIFTNKLSSKKNPKPNSSVTQKTLKKRANQTFIYMDSLGGGEDKDLDREHLLAQMVKLKPQLTKNALEKTNSPDFAIPQPLSAEEALIFQQHSAKNVDRMRTVRRVFKNKLKVNVFPSEKIQRVKEKDMLERLIEEDDLDIGKMFLMTGRHKDKTPKYENKEYVRFKDIKKFITKVLHELILSGKLDLNSDFFKNDCKGKVWVVTSADHGGDIRVCNNMKFCIQILNFSIYCYGMYSATDCVENLAKFHNMYFEQFRDLVENGIVYEGVHIPIIHLDKGDMKQSFYNQGLGGAAGTMPSRFSKVTLSHLRGNHKDGSPHTPEHCFIDDDDQLPIRTFEEIISKYHENFAKNEGNYDKMHKSQALFDNVVGLPLYPFKSVYLLIIDILHFKLQSVKDGYVEMEKRCKGENALEDEEKEKNRLENALDAEQSLLREKIEHQVSLSEEISSKDKKIQRIKFVNDKDLKGLQSFVCADSGGVINKKFQKYGKSGKFDSFCPSSSCLLTKYDEIQWMNCEQCQSWFHPYCLRRLANSSNISQSCMKCQPIPNNIDELISELNLLRGEYTKGQKDISQFKDIIRKVSDRILRYKTKNQIDLDKKMISLGIDRKAFQGGQILGNHCDILLKKFEELLPFMPKQSDQSLFRDYFNCLNNILGPCSRPAFYDNATIESINQNCFTLGVLYPKIFRNIIPKVDDVVFHLPIFLKEYRTIGLLNSEDTERIHREFNSIMRDLVCVRDGPEKLKIAFKRLYLRRLTDMMNTDFVRPKKEI